MNIDSESTDIAYDNEIHFKFMSYYISQEEYRNHLKFWVRNFFLKFVRCIKRSVNLNVPIDHNLLTEYVEAVVMFRHSVGIGNHTGIDTAVRFPRAL